MLPSDEANVISVGNTVDKPAFYINGQEFSIESILDAWKPPESVYPTRVSKAGRIESITCHERSPLVAAEKFAKPRAVLAAFPGTNCEIDTAMALHRAGIEPEVHMIRNLTAADFRTIRPGNGTGHPQRTDDYPARRILRRRRAGWLRQVHCAFYRNPRITEAVDDLLYRRDGLMLGICNGFQALLKLGLLTTGHICPVDDTFPTLTYNLIGRHQSRYAPHPRGLGPPPWMTPVQARRAVSCTRVPRRRPFRSQ